MPHSTDSSGDRIRIELVRSLFATTAPSIIMSVGFIVSAWLICLRSTEPGIVALAIAGAAASFVRIAIVLGSLKEARGEELSLRRALLLERRFAGSFFAFAAILGAFGAYVLTLDAPESHMLAICLLVGYAAGVAAGVGLRPWIAIPSMVAAVVPAAGVALFTHDPIYGATGMMLTAFLGGGVHSVLHRHRTVNGEIGKRMTFAGLARRDALTGLPNRLALREWFDTRAALTTDQRILAVHCLDLDGFKATNDRFGHPTGDDLLRAVSARLTRNLRSGDIAARIGGDEFVVVQSGLTHADEAQLLAQRLCRSIDDAFEIRGHKIHVATSIGFVTSTDSDENLDSLLAVADEALYAAKRSHGGVVRYDRDERSAQASLAA